MRFCMLTTFFGAHSFGGDAAYVDRLVRALLRRGHEVDVVHCVDSFEAVRSGVPLRDFVPPPGLRIHSLRSRLGRLSPLWTHQTGLPGPKGRAIAAILRDGDFDVVHFHNISLLGGPGLIRLAADHSRAVRLMTAHEHWLVCPTSLLWKLDREPCEQPQCSRCTLAAGRPVQLWRHTPAIERALDRLDALIAPSRHTIEAHRARGIRRPMVHLPYFLPDDWAAPGPVAPACRSDRPYFAMAGRLVREKGFQDVIPLMRQLPETDLVIAGAGPLEGELRRLAGEMSNVRFAGLLGPPELAGLFQRARAVVVPSLFYETFGYVALEAFSVATPVVARDRGALPEVAGASGGGILFRTPAELLDALRKLAGDASEAARLGALGSRSLSDRWSEELHLRHYFETIAASGADSAPARTSSTVAPKPI